MQLLHIGRSTECDIILNGSTVSRQHAQLFIEDDGSVHIIDLNSTNGTFVNGRKVIGKQRLQSSDILKIGEELLFWQDHVQAAASAGPRAVPAEYGQPNAAKSKRTRNWIIASAGTALAGIVLVFVLLKMGGSGGDVIGNWKEKADGEAWIHIASNGSYEEGYGKETILKDTKWEQRGDNTLVLTRDKISIVRRFTLSGDQMTMQQDSAETVFVRE